jgi:hypothetical protein
MGISESNIAGVLMIKSIMGRLVPFGIIPSLLMSSSRIL